MFQGKPIAASMVFRHFPLREAMKQMMQAFGCEPQERVLCMGCGSYPHSWGLRADNTCNLLLHTRTKKLIRLRQDFLLLRPDNYLFYAIQGL